MATAEIVGGENRDISKSLVENPSIITTVINAKKTSVIKPVPQKVEVPVHDTISAYAFSSEGISGPPMNMNNPNIATSTAMSIPVSLTKQPIRNDPTLSGYEIPQITHAKPSHSEDEATSFLEKKKKSHAYKELKTSIEDDIHQFLTQFENTKDKEDKIKVMIEGKQRLFHETEELEAAINADIQDLLEVKVLAVKLNNLVKKYDDKMMKDLKDRSLKLADVITIKDLLRDKIHKEMQGIRVSTEEYKELDQVNPADINEISKKITEKFGVDGIPGVQK